MMRSRFSPVLFAIVYCATYWFVLFKDAPLFRYYPRTQQFCWGWQSLTGNGPQMVWYGLLVDAAIAGCVVAAIVPGQAVTATLRNFLWIFPLLAMLGCAYLMMHFFV